MNTLAERLKSALQSSRMTQADLARACKVKPSSVSDWLTGETRSLKAGPLLDASELLHVHPRWLYDGKGPRDVRYAATPSVSLVATEPGADASPWPFQFIRPPQWQAVSFAERQRVEAFALATIQTAQARKAPTT